MANTIGMILLAIYLLLVGLLSLTNLQFAMSGVIVGILAIAAGGCLLFAHARR